MALTPRRRNPLAYPAGLTPGFDPTHFASAGMTFGNGMSVVPSGETFVNLLAGTPGTLNVNFSQFPIAEINPYIGKTVRGAGQGWTSFSGQSTTAPAQATIACIFTASGTNSYGVLNAGAGGNGWSLSVTSGLLLEICGWFGAVDSSFALTAGDPYFVAASCNASASNFLALNLKTGKILTSSGIGSPTPTTGIYNGTTFVGTSSLNSAYLGQLGPVMYAPAFMSMGALLQWAQDPWAFWYPTPSMRPPRQPVSWLGSLSSTINKTLTATCTTSATLIRSVAKKLTATCTSTSTLIRSIAKTLLATCTSTSVAVATKAKLLTLVATCTTTASLVTHFGYGRLLVATCTSTSTMIRGVAKTLAATCTSTSVFTMTRSFFRLLTATCTSTSTVLAHKCVVTFKTLVATCTTSSSLSTLKSLASSVASLAQLLRPYKPPPAPVIPGAEVLYLLNELQKVSNAFNAHVAATQSLDARLKAGGL